MVKNDKRQQTGNESSVLERGAVVGGHECLEVSEALVDEEAAEEQSGEEEVDQDDHPGVLCQEAPVPRADRASQACNRILL